MIGDPDRHSLPSEDLAQLRARAADAATRLRKLVEQSQELQAHAASLLTENQVLLEELYLRRLFRRKVALFP